MLDLNIVDASQQDIIENYLADRQLSIKQILDLIPDTLSTKPILFVGAIASGMGHPASDIDIMVLDSKSVGLELTVSTSDFEENAVRVKSNQLLNLTFIPTSTLESMAGRLSHLFSIVSDAGKSDQWYGFSASELQILHDIKAGLPLVNCEQVDQWRDNLHLPYLHFYTTIYYSVRSEQLFEDCKSIISQGDADTALLMLRESVLALSASVLSSVGETSPNLKWRLALIKKCASAIGEDNALALIDSITGWQCEDPMKAIDAYSEMRSRLLGDIDARLPGLVAFRQAVHAAMI